MSFRKKIRLGKINRANVALNKTSKAILPEGKMMTREEILTKLNLDPNVSPDAWLNIIGCLINATGLKPEDAKVLLNNDVIKTDMLLKDQIKAIKKIR